MVRLVGVETDFKRGAIQACIHLVLWWLAVRCLYSYSGALVELSERFRAMDPTLRLLVGPTMGMAIKFGSWICGFVLSTALALKELPIRMTLVGLALACFGFSVFVQPLMIDGVVDWRDSKAMLVFPLILPVFALASAFIWLRRKGNGDGLELQIVLLKFFLFISVV